MKNEQSDSNKLVVQKTKSPPEGSKRTRTELRSVAFSLKNVALFLLAFLVLIGLEKLYKEPALKFTLSPDGIPHTQSITSKSRLEWWKF